jgi:hypothetical protein
VQFSTIYACFVELWVETRHQCSIYIQGSMCACGCSCVTTPLGISLDLSDGLWWIWALFNLESLLKIMICNIIRSVHVSRSYKRKSNASASSIYTWIGTSVILFGVRTPWGISLDLIYGINWVWALFNRELLL